MGVYEQKVKLIVLRSFYKVNIFWCCCWGLHMFPGVGCFYGFRSFSSFTGPVGHL